MYSYLCCWKILNLDHIYIFHIGIIISKFSLILILPYKYFLMKLKHLTLVDMLENYIILTIIISYGQPTIFLATWTTCCILPLELHLGSSLVFFVCHVLSQHLITNQIENLCLTTSSLDNIWTSTYRYNI